MGVLCSLAGVTCLTKGLDIPVHRWPVVPLENTLKGLVKGEMGTTEGRVVIRLENSQSHRGRNYNLRHTTTPMLPGISNMKKQSVIASVVVVSPLAEANVVLRAKIRR